ncbi:histone H1-like [Mustelus asterias]
MADAAAIETAPAVAPVAPVKSPKKKKKAAPVRSKSTAPKLTEQIRKLVADNTERRGMSGAAIRKALAISGLDVDKNRGRIKLAIRKSVEQGILVQSTGHGVSGSLKLAKQMTKAKAAKTAKKPATKKTIVKRSPAKKLAKKTPIKKSPAKKSPAKKAVAKKLAKKVAKKTSVKKAAPAPKKVAPKKAKAAKAPKPKAATAAKGKRTSKK